MAPPLLSELASTPAPGPSLPLFSNYPAHPFHPHCCCSMGPGAQDLSTVAYAYTSSVDLVAHPNAGLIGVLLVSAPGSLSPDTGLPQVRCC